MSRGHFRLIYQSRQVLMSHATRNELLHRPLEIMSRNITVFYPSISDETYFPSKEYMRASEKRLMESK
jgi:hypothetical protein